ncbi:MAG: hypothetical protein Q7R40_13930 [Phaeospirillum sp.]|nr:hypothetical protein [Phaeospirillum sp.]
MGGSYLSKRPWIPLATALDRVAKVVEKDAAWLEISQAIIDGALCARGLLDGIAGDVSGALLSARARELEVPESGIFWISEEYRRRLLPMAPGIVEQIEVDENQLATLWPISTSISQENCQGPKRECPAKAIQLLENGEVRPGHGSVAKLARLIADTTVYSPSSVERYIRSAVRDWETKNPDGNPDSSGK